MDFLVPYRAYCQSTIGVFRV